MIINEKIGVLTLDNSASLRELNFRVKSSGYRKFFNSLHITLKMNNKQQAMFDFLCEKMDEQNRVFIDIALKNEFKELVKAVTSGKIKYAPHEIDLCIRALKELNLMFEVGDSKKSYYYINPKYAFKGSKKDRLKLIQKIVQDRIIAKKGVEMLVSVPLDEHYQIKATN